jgi:hypothetical protein
MSRSSNSIIHQPDGGPGNLQAVPQWVATMRQAAQEVISAEDVKAIVQNQVEKAKSGDQAAIKFVFDQILGGPLKGATFVQNVYHNDSPDQTGEAAPVPRVPPTRTPPRDPFK